MLRVLFGRGHRPGIWKALALHYTYQTLTNQRGQELVCHQPRLGLPKPITTMQTITLPFIIFKGILPTFNPKGPHNLKSISSFVLQKNKKVFDQNLLSCCFSWLTRGPGLGEGHCRAASPRVGSSGPLREGWDSSLFYGSALAPARLFRPG